MTATYESTDDYTVCISDAGRERLASEQRLTNLEPFYNKFIIGNACAVLLIAGLVIRQLTGG